MDSVINEFSGFFLSVTAGWFRILSCTASMLDACDEYLTSVGEQQHQERVSIARLVEVLLNMYWI